MLPEETVNILLVDDHPENLLSLGAILETPSYNLVKALSGEEALKCLLYQDFAVVLMDVQMPGMDGFEVAAIIRERKRSRMTPIIFLTAIDQTHNRVLTGYGLGAVDYLFKPVVPEILQSKIMVFVGLFRKTEEIKRQATQVADVNQQLAEEIIQRKQVEEALQKTHDELEIRVQERTAELTKANSELRQSEQRYRFLADAMAHIVWTAQPDGGVDYYNQRWYDYTGTTFERTQNWEWQSVLHPDDQERCLECWIEAIRTGSSYQTESRFKQAMDGAYRWHLGRVLPMKDLDGKIVLWVGTFTDIDDQKRTQEQILLSLREKEVLLQEIHHRVKNNLQIISSLLNLQSGYVSDQGPLEVLQECANRVASMALIHEQLYQSEDLERISLSKYIQNLTANLFISYKINSNAIALQMNTNELELSIDVAIPLGLIINELVTNSLKHAFTLGRTGEIRVEVHADNDSQLTLIVSDNGIGLPPDLDFPNTDSLGLQLVSILTTQLSGTIELNRNLGTEFQIRLFMDSRDLVEKTL